jgi:hypothetical protein
MRGPTRLSRFYRSFRRAASFAMSRTSDPYEKAPHNGPLAPLAGTLMTDYRNASSWPSYAALAPAAFEAALSARSLSHISTGLAM